MCIRDSLSRANGLYLVNFSGMTVLQANNLRREFFKLEADYIVIKNTLLKRALQEVGGYDDMFPYLVHQTGLVVSYNDPVAPARILEKFNKDNAQKPAVKVCVIEKQVFDGSRLSEIAALPSRNDLTRVASPWMTGSTTGKNCTQNWLLHFSAMSRARPRCCFWSSPTGPCVPW